jgi:hypothetical protein
MDFLHISAKLALAAIPLTIGYGPWTIFPYIYNKAKTGNEQKLFFIEKILNKWVFTDYAGRVGAGCK